MPSLVVNQIQEMGGGSVGILDKTSVSHDRHGWCLKQKNRSGRGQSVDTLARRVAARKNVRDKFKMTRYSLLGLGLGYDRLGCFKELDMKRLVHLCVALVAPMLPCSALLAYEPATRPAATRPTTQAAERFLRFVDRGATGSRLETEDVIYRNEQGVTVRLVAAVHIAEKTYYEGLNDSFEKEDAVLYEMVKPKEMPVQIGRASCRERV